MATVTKEYDLKISTKQAQANIDELNKSLELQETLIDDIEKELRQYQKELNKTSAKDLSKRQKLNDKIKQTKERLVDEKVALKQVNKDRKKANEVMKESEKNAADYSGVLGTIDSQTGGAISGFTNLTKTIGGATKGFGLMGKAIMATGLGALVLIVSSLGAAFTGSEEGQNKFAKIMSVIGALTGNLVDLLADLGDAIISAFENPVESLNSFVDLLKNNLITRFEGLLNLIPNLGRAVEQLFKGNFSEAGKIAADSVGQVVLGVESVTDTVANATKAVKEFTAEQIKEGKAAAEVADMRAKADKIERALIVDRSKLESEIALLRLKSREEEKFSAAERKQALLDAQALEDQLLDKETEFLELRRDAQMLENTFSRTNKENLTKEAEAIAAVNRQQAARANTARQLQREVNTISKQITAEEKAEATELANFRKSLRDAEAVSEEDRRALELIKIQEHYDALILQAEENNVNTDALNDARQLALAEKQAAFDATDLERKKKIADDEAAIEQAKEDRRQATFDNAVALAGEETKLGKALLLAKQFLLAKNFIMDAKASIMNAKKATTDAVVTGAEASTEVSGSVAKAANTAPPPFNIPFILTAIATGVSIISAVKSAVGSTKKAAAAAGGSSGGGTVPSPASVTPSAAPPAFNIVGSSGTNQLADAIGGQTQQPVQAFVVASDVTTAQSLERNTIEGATIG
tara:strand:+ start:2543 stop:4639 length:2097 start_codon:yes stop_codon:yes gene_type:complete